MKPPGASTKSAFHISQRNAPLPPEKTSTAGNLMKSMRETFVTGTELQWTLSQTGFNLYCSFSVSLLPSAFSGPFLSLFLFLSLLLSFHPSLTPPPVILL
ncbi:hypothetical protein JZ751_004345 [Albula glossodonta]|uniref:Uncharacterized protein n=1 Tax=Albula glossodonta TaxID=121402 RepID=A0A8T2NDA8_9TELE|nr:hypothetical protein JZ751_004345 [Albula glossodonta]